MTAMSSPFSGFSGPVAVAVSGGADSLFTLLRLRELGADVMAVHGLFARHLDLDAAGTGDPSAAPFPPHPERAEAAARVIDALGSLCRSLGVPFHLADCSVPFVERVVRPFVQAYAKGLTPNPCALCNASIKFGLLLEKARALGAAHLATGHYARLMHGHPAQGVRPPFQPPAEALSAFEALFPCPPALLQGADPLKDQSYFLSLTPRESLAAALFPLGGMRKKDVLSALKMRGVSVPQPGESQEVCFVPNDAYREFLPGAARRLGVELPGPGPVLLEGGRGLGEHKGLWQYTEGQRRGLGIAWSEPLHVLGKERETNTLRLGPRAAMRAEGCLCSNVNVLLPPEYWPETVLVKTRYRETPKEAAIEVSADGSALRVRFLSPERSVAPGQVAAVYVPLPGQGGDDPVLRLAAGGIITERIND